MSVTTSRSFIMSVTIIVRRCGFTVVCSTPQLLDYNILTYSQITQLLGFVYGETLVSFPDHMEWAPGKGCGYTLIQSTVPRYSCEITTFMPYS